MYVATNDLKESIVEERWGSKACFTRPGVSLLFVMWHQLVGAVNTMYLEFEMKDVKQTFSFTVLQATLWPDEGVHFGALSLSCSWTCRYAPRASVSVCTVHTHTHSFNKVKVTNKVILCLFYSDWYRLCAPDWRCESSQAVFLPPETA